MSVRHLCVFDGDDSPLHDWAARFAGCSLPDGSRIRVLQASWLDTAVVSYGDSGCMLSVHAIRDSDAVAQRSQAFTFRPDFVLMRNQVRGPTPGSDRRNVLFGLMHANVPAVNSLVSEYMQLERPIMFGALRDIHRRLGEQFPLVTQHYYGYFSDMVISPELPCIVKVSHAHAGMGKMFIGEQQAFRDLSTVMALHRDSCTAEPFIEPDYGLRVQRIGSHTRCWKKVFTGSGWKSQFGGADLQEIQPTAAHLRWADEAAKCFGGLDIFALDAIHGRDGKDYIIELNGTAIGLKVQTADEDQSHIRDLVLQRMSQLYPAPVGSPEQPTACAATADSKKSKRASKKDTKPNRDEQANIVDEAADRKAHRKSHKKADQNQSKKADKPAKSSEVADAAP